MCSKVGDSAVLGAGTIISYQAQDDYLVNIQIIIPLVSIRLQYTIVFLVE